MTKLTQKEWLERRAKLLRQAIITGVIDSVTRDRFQKVLDLFDQQNIYRRKINGRLDDLKNSNCNGNWFQQ